MNTRVTEGRLTQENLTTHPGTDPTTFFYDQTNRLVRRTEAGNVMSAYQYVANGNLIVLTPFVLKELEGVP